MTAPYPRPDAPQAAAELVSGSAAPLLTDKFQLAFDSQHKPGTDARYWDLLSAGVGVHPRSHGDSVARSELQQHLAASSLARSRLQSAGARGWLAFAAESRNPAEYALSYPPPVR